MELRSVEPLSAHAALDKMQREINQFGEINLLESMNYCADPLVEEIFNQFQ